MSELIRILLIKLGLSLRKHNHSLAGVARRKVHLNEYKLSLEFALIQSIFRAELGQIVHMRENLGVSFLLLQSLKFTEP